MLRVIDANLNRICEGLRVIEDILRFEFNDSQFVKSLKEIRHSIRKKFYSIESLFERDSILDCGKDLEKIESDRNNVFDLLKANFLRVEEGLRVIEESIKFEKKFIENLSMIKSFRFQIYELEKRIIIKYSIIDKLKNYLIVKSCKNINNLFEFINNKNISSIQLECDKINFDTLNSIVDHCKKNSIMVFMKNNLDLAIIFDTHGIVIDENYYKFSQIRKNYKRVIGYILRDTSIFYEGDFFILEKINNIKDLTNIEKPLILYEKEYEKIEEKLKNSVNKCIVYD